MKLVETIETADCWFINLPQLLLDSGACKSKSAARQLIKQGAVEIDGVKIYETHLNINDGAILHCGKRFWRELRMPVLKVEVYDE